MTAARTPASPRLDPALAERLDAEIADADAGASPDPAADRRVKRRLLRRIAAETTDAHLTSRAADQTGWQPFGNGLTLKVLHRAGDVMSYLLRLAPGASLPVHRHPVDEECVVLEGEVIIGQRLRLGPGAFHLGRQDVLHDRLHSPGGALIFLRGAVPEIAHAV